MKPKFNKCPNCEEQKDVRAKKCRRCHDRTPYSELLEQGATKLCKGCNRELSIENFSERKTRITIRPRARCKECECKSAKNYRTDNPDKHRDSKQQWSKKNPYKISLMSKRKFARKLGYSESEVKTIIERFISTSCCDICNDSVENVGTLHLDHCHRTNAFRGFICGKCNFGLGNFLDSPTRLSQAIEYLSKTKDSS
jgi:hypothetical protein